MMQPALQHITTIDTITPMSGNSEISFSANLPVTDNELNTLFAVSWPNFKPRTFQPALKRNLAHICAYHSTLLIGFVNLAWDGGIHAFILDTTVHPDFRLRGIGQELVRRAIEAAREQGVEWVHVDYEPHLQSFYEGCGFKSTAAGLLNLK
jgi:GNAT superfamily N-acetyltransferase